MDWKNNPKDASSVVVTPKITMVTESGGIKIGRAELRSGRVGGWRGESRGKRVGT